MRILFSPNFAYAKFHENKTLMKNSEFTVLYLWAAMGQTNIENVHV